IVSGTAYTSTGTAAAQASIGLYENGASLANLTTGTNGDYYYLVLAPNTLTSGAALGATLTLNGASAYSGDTYTLAASLSSNSLPGFNVQAGAVSASQIADTSYSAFLAHLHPAVV